MPSRRSLSAVAKQSIYARCNCRCYYCGINLQCDPTHKPYRDWLVLRGTGLVMVLDHLYPIIRGGPDVRENLVAACSACNLAKGWLTLAEFVLVKALRLRNFDFRFYGQGVAAVSRDWLHVYSEDRERELFIHNFPEGREAYSRGRSLRKRVKMAARQISS